MKTNLEISEHLNLIGEYYANSGDDQRSLSFFKASSSVKDYPQELAKMTLAPSSVKYCGPSITTVIQEFLHSGSSGRLQTLEKSGTIAPITIRELTKIPGVGLATAYKLWKEQGITSLASLEEALKSGKIVDEKLSKSIEFMKSQALRVPYQEALFIGEKIYDQLESIQVEDHSSKSGKRYLIKQIEFAGSLRRKRETVKDIDILVATSTDWDRNLLREHIKALFPDVVADGDTRTRLRVDGRGVDIIYTTLSSWGTCLAYLTGSATYNVFFRTWLNQKRYKLNEYNLTYMSGTPSQKILTFLTEEALYDQVGVFYVPPDQRETSKVLELSIQVRDLKKIPGMTLERAIQLRQEYGVTSENEYFALPEMLRQ